MAGNRLRVAQYENPKIAPRIINGRNPSFVKCTKENKRDVKIIPFVGDSILESDGSKKPRNMTSSHIGATTPRTKNHKNLTQNPSPSNIFAPDDSPCKSLLDINVTIDRCSKSIAGNAKNPRPTMLQDLADVSYTAKYSLNLGRYSLRDRLKSIYIDNI